VRCASHIAETSRIHLVICGMQKKTIGPCLAAINRIAISLMSQVRRECSLHLDAYSGFCCGRPPSPTKCFLPGSRGSNGHAAVLAAMLSALDDAAQVLHKQLHAVADAQDRDACLLEGDSRTDRKMDR
jgi:hypothetical protein